MLKILLARLQQHVNCEFPDVQAGFRKGRDQIANILWIIKKARVPEKNKNKNKTSISALLSMPKPLTVGITAGYEKFLMRSPHLPPEKICMQGSISDS